jgi:PEP-CTERM motif
METVMKCHTIVVALVIAGATTTRSSAGKEYHIGRLEMPPSPNSVGDKAVVERSDDAVSAGSANTIYTGLVDGSSRIYTAEPIPPARSDVVTFSGVEQQINDYVAIAGTGLTGQRRFVTESATSNGDGSTTNTFRIRCVNAAGAPADLWPQGVAANGIPLPNGGVGLGLAIDPAFGGQNVVDLDPGTTITGLTVEVVSNGISSGLIDLSLATFITPSTSNWNGQLGLVFFGGANDADIDSQVTVRLTSMNVPEPSSLGILGVAVATRTVRRRRRAHPAR